MFLRTCLYLPCLILPVQTHRHVLEEYFLVCYSYIYSTLNSDYYWYNNYAECPSKHTCFVYKGKEGVSIFCFLHFLQWLYYYVVGRVISEIFLPWLWKNHSFKGWKETTKVMYTCIATLISYNTLNSLIVSIIANALLAPVVSRATHWAYHYHTSHLQSGV